MGAAVRRPAAARLRAVGAGGGDDALLVGGTGGAAAKQFGGATFGLGLGVLYLLLIPLYLFPGLRLLRYGAAIQRMRGRADAAAMTEALDHQHAFWRFVGIAAIAVLILYALIFVGAMAVGILAAGSS